MENVFASAAVAAIVSGVITLSLPWVQWGAERRKLRVHHQREAISEWRSGIETWQTNNGGAVSVYPASFINEKWYFSLRRHLTEEERAEFEKERDGEPPNTPSARATILISGAVHQEAWNHFTRLMLDSIDRIEREWKLP